MCSHAYCAEFQDSSQNGAEHGSHKRTDIRNDVKDACYECYSYRRAESDTGYQPHEQEVEQRHAHHFDHQSYEISGKKVLDVTDSGNYAAFNLVRHQRSDNLAEQHLVLQEEERNEHHGKNADTYGHEERCHILDERGQ